jgi:hypothetical protein
MRAMLCCQYLLVLSLCRLFGASEASDSISWRVVLLVFYVKLLNFAVAYILWI